MQTALLLEDLPESQELMREVAQGAFPGIRVCCVESVADALKMIGQFEFDLALIDLSLPDGNGQTVVEAIASQFPKCTIVVATIFDDDAHLFSALRTGAQGYLLKDHAPEQLVAQLRGISDGHPPLSPPVARRLLDHFRKEIKVPRTTTPEDFALTTREQEVLTQLARGVNIAAIGKALGISHHTVGDHVKNLYRKLNVSSRAEAALQARRIGLA